MSADNGVMVFIEQNDGQVAEVSLELLSKATELAGTLGVPVEAVALGHNLQDELQTLGDYGCARVYSVDHPGLAHFTSLPYATILAGIIQEAEPRICLFGATTTGRDLAPRIASRLQCGLTADCTDLQIGEYKQKGKVYDQTLLQIRPAFGGNIIATIVSPESRPSMATVREGVMPKRVVPEPQPVEVIEKPCPLRDEEFVTEVLEVVREEKAVDLKGAKIIVSAGMGAASPEALSLVRELASVLGGVVGGSRPMVDSGLLVKDHQVGQTGTTVRPNLYIACGISGQIQHRAGMAESKRIIAINADPEAPIFEFAHYGIVGDVLDVVPRMIKAYKEKA
jgi:electron transfer flavoprotein alpha subunit